MKKGKRKAEVSTPPKPAKLPLRVGAIITDDGPTIGQVTHVIGKLVIYRVLSDSPHFTANINQNEQSWCRVDECDVIGHAGGGPLGLGFRATACIRTADKLMRLRDDLLTVRDVLDRREAEVEKMLETIDGYATDLFLYAGQAHSCEDANDNWSKKPAKELPKRKGGKC